MSTYSYERLVSTDLRDEFRVSDGQDNRIATCYDEANAKRVVAALNGRSLTMSPGEASVNPTRLTQHTDAVTYGQSSVWMSRAHAESLALRELIQATEVSNEWKSAPNTASNFYYLKSLVERERKAGRYA